MNTRSRTSRRGIVTLMVLWVLVLAVVVVGAIQAASWSQAAAGRESLARVRAHWAARAGIEAAIARLEADTENPNPDDAFAVFDELAEVADGELDGAAYSVGTEGQDGRIAGPADAHAKININLMDAEALMTLPYMTEDVAQAIVDWVDSDDDPNPLGAEVGFYQNLRYPVEPRNGPFRSIQELELVANAYPPDIRAEDWNLNGLLDPNENDGDASLPPDNADGKLDAGWSAILTARSAEGGFGPSGEAKIDLMTAAAGDLVSRLKVDNDQAEAILTYVTEADQPSVFDFIAQDLDRLVAQSQPQGAGSTQPPDLTREQLAALIDETGVDVDAAKGVFPGRLNINTCDEEALDYLPGLDPSLADAIISERESRRNGFASIVDLLDIPGMSRQTLTQIAGLIDVRSAVFVVTSRGRDQRTGLEVEMIATLDRSTLPLTIQEIIVR